MAKEAIVVGKWTVGFDKGSNHAVLIFDFAGRQQMVFAIPADQAQAMGRDLQTAADDASQRKN